MRLQAILLCIGLFCPETLFGQESQKSDGDLLVKIESVKSPRSITDRLDVHVVVIARTSNVTDLRELRWKVPEEICGMDCQEGDSTEGSAKVQQGWTQEHRPDDIPPVLNVNSSFEYTFILPPAPFEWKHIAFGSSSPTSFKRDFPLFFNGGKYTIQVAAKAAEEPWSEETTDEVSNIEIEFLPSPIALVLGGLFGVILLASFERLADLMAVVTKGSWPRHDDGQLDWGSIWRKGKDWFLTRFLSGLVQLLLGTCVVTIFFVLVGLGQGFDLPINLKVSGFFSAIPVGLCMHFLVKRIYGRFVPNRRNRASTTREPRPARTPIPN